MVILRSDYDQVALISGALVNQCIESVIYRQTEHGGLLDVPVGNCHEIDLDFVLVLSGGGILSLSWERDNLTEGMAGSLVGEIASTEGVVNVDAGQSPQWHALLGQRVILVEFGWQTSEAHCPESLWSMRLALASGANVVVALGELDSSLNPTYFPDSFVVIFDEGTARSYTHPGVNGTAWAGGA